MNKKYPTFFLTWFNKFLRVPYPGIPTTGIPINTIGLDLDAFVMSFVGGWATVAGLVVVHANTSIWHFIFVLPSSGKSKVYQSNIRIWKSRGG